MSTLKIEMPPKMIPMFAPERGSLRYRVFFGGRGCVHPDTIIDTPKGAVKVTDFKGGFVYSYVNGELKQCLASASKKFTKEDMYRVELCSSKAITVTDEHKFLTSKGWKMLSELSVGDDVLSLSPKVSYDSQVKHCASSLLSLLSGVQHLMKTLVDYQDDCLLYRHQCDPQPQFLEDSALASLPLLSGELQHSYHALCHLGGQVFFGKDSLSSTSLHASSHDALRFVEQQYCGDLESYNAEKSFVLISEFYLEIQQFLYLLNLALPSHKLQLLPEVYDNLLNQVQSLQKLLHKLDCISLEISDDDPLSYPVIGKDFIISKITSISKQAPLNYYDLHVYGSNNYLSDGIVNHNSGKSFNVAKMSLIWGALESLKVLCVREFENSIKHSFHAELKSAVQSCQWLSTQYDVGVDYLRHKTNGTEFIFKGLARNIQAVKSMAQIDLVICEESETISPESWRDLLPTIRAPKSEIHIIFNPMNRMSWVAQTFLENDPPPRSLVCKMNYNDNPFFSMELEEQRLHAKATMTEEEYNHIWEGEYLEAEDGTVIRRSWIMAAIDAHLKLDDVQWGGATTLGFDVADDGDDKCATATMKGSILLDLDEWKAGEDEIVKSTSRALSNARKLGASHIGYDAIGVGASVGSHLNEVGFRDHYKFIANAKVVFPDKYYNSAAKITNQDMFKTLKDQSWWALADRFRNTYNAINNGEKFTADEMISISSDIKEDILYRMINELSTPLRDFDGAGRVVVEGKPSMKKRGANSPNIADSFVIASARSLLVRKSIFDYV